MQPDGQHPVGFLYRLVGGFRGQTQGEKGSRILQVLQLRCERRLQRRQLLKIRLEQTVGALELVCAHPAGLLEHYFQRSAQVLLDRVHVDLGIGFVTLGGAFLGTLVAFVLVEKVIQIGGVFRGGDVSDAICGEALLVHIHNVNADQLNHDLQPEGLFAGCATQLLGLLGFICVAIFGFLVVVCVHSAACDSAQIVETELLDR
mmetsp:Transcript_15813/g.27799  ORF Transcript_15813/g.27799 Transcript_15813/m.27799 type:complete len:203 (-) Transcript_15813:559-1167(-)